MKLYCMTEDIQQALVHMDQANHLLQMMISHSCVQKMTLNNFKALLHLNMTYWSMLGAFSITGALMT